MLWSVCSAKNNFRRLCTPFFLTLGHVGWKIRLFQHYRPKPARRKGMHRGLLWRTHRANENTRHGADVGAARRSCNESGARSIRGSRSTLMTWIRIKAMHARLREKCCYPSQRKPFSNNRPRSLGYSNVSMSSASAPSFPAPSGGG